MALKFSKIAALMVGTAIGLSISLSTLAGSLNQLEALNSADSESFKKGLSDALSRGQVGDLKVVEHDHERPQVIITPSRKKDGKCQVKAQMLMGPRQNHQAIDLINFHSEIGTKLTYTGPNFRLAHVTLRGKRISDGTSMEQQYLSSSAAEWFSLAAILSGRAF